MGHSEHTHAEGPAATEGGEATRLTADISRWPLLHIRWPAGRQDDGDVRAAMRMIEEVVARDVRHVCLIDVRGAAPLPPSQFGLVLKVAAEVQPRSRCIANGFVFGSPRHRAVLDSIRWALLTRQAFQCFEHPDPALRWLRGHLSFPS